MKKTTRKLQFTKKAEITILARDETCIFCKMKYHMEDVSLLGQCVTDYMHYIPKSRMGLGIPENGALGCRSHHMMLDNGNKGRREEMLELFKNYLMERYPDWSEDKIVYSKWRDLDVH